MVKSKWQGNDLQDGNKLKLKFLPAMLHILTISSHQQSPSSNFKLQAIMQFQTPRPVAQTIPNLPIPKSTHPVNPPTCTTYFPSSLQPCRPLLLNTHTPNHQMPPRKKRRKTIPPLQIPLHRPIKLHINPPNQPRKQ